MNLRTGKTLAAISSSSSTEVVEKWSVADEGEEESSTSEGKTDIDDDESSCYSPSENDDSETLARDAGDSEDNDDGCQQEQEKRSNCGVSGKRGDQDDDALYNLVIDFLQGKGEKEVKKVTLNALRVYLRRHGLRISGTKEVCLDRIREHWRLTDENTESEYPRSSFTINCKGDVCKGDVVLFTQRVYNSRGRDVNRVGKVKRCGKDTPTRTVAGRVVKESYGAAKQQHTFTVEVFWSEGANKLPPLFPLLVKGRNLYRIQTFRQPWKDEAERKQVLDEKHKRGAMARQTRDIRVGHKDAGWKKTNSSNYGYPSRSSSLAKQFSCLHLENGCPPKQPTVKNAFGGVAPTTKHVPRPQSSQNSRSTSCPPRSRQWNVWVRTDTAQNNDYGQRNGNGSAKFHDTYGSPGRSAVLPHQQFFRRPNVWVRPDQSTNPNKMSSCAEQLGPLHNNNGCRIGKETKFQDKCLRPADDSRQRINGGQNVCISSGQSAQDKMPSAKPVSSFHHPNDNGWRNGNGVKFQAGRHADASYQQFNGRQSNKYTNHRHGRPYASPEPASRPPAKPYGSPTRAYNNFHGSPPPPSNISGLRSPYASPEPASRPPPKPYGSPTRAYYNFHSSPPPPSNISGLGRPYASPERASRPHAKPFGSPTRAYNNFHGSPPPPSNISGLGRPYDQERRRMGFQQQLGGGGGGFVKCSRKGCVEWRTEGCSASACWRCCIRSGARCRVHVQ